jgi:hypothetical protein
MPVKEPTGKTKKSAVPCPNWCMNSSCAAPKFRMLNSGNVTVTMGNRVQSSTHRKDAKLDTWRSRTKRGNRGFSSSSTKDALAPLTAPLIISVVDGGGEDEEVEGVLNNVHGVYLVVTFWTIPNLVTLEGVVVKASAILVE